MEDERNLNLELLRIFAIILIVLSHFCTFKDINLYNFPLCLNLIGIFFVGKWGGLGNDIFLVISCFFLVNNKKFKIERILKIVLETQLYAIFTLMFASVIGIEEITVINIIKSLLAPFLSYWFITAYLFMIIISPVANRIIWCIEKIVYKKLIYVLTIIILYSVLWDLHKMSDIFLVIYIYFLVGYIKRFNILTSITTKNKLVLSILLYIGIITFYVILSSLGHTKFAAIFTRRYSIFTIIISILLIGTALDIQNINCKLKPCSKNVILSLSGSTLAVYILQENMWLKRWLQDSIFKFEDWFMNNNLFIPYVIICSFIVFLLFGIIDVFRRKLVEKHLFKMLSSNTLVKKINRIVNRY